MTEDDRDAIHTLLTELRTDVKKLLREVGSLRGVTAVLSAIVSAVVAGIIMAILSGCGAYPPDQSARMHDSAVSVVGLVTPEGHAFCTGTSTALGVVTAAHCVAGVDEVLVGALSGLSEDRTRWETSVPLAVLRVDEDADIAVLEPLDQLLAPHAAVRSLPPVLGEPVLVIGHGASIPYTYHAGNVGREAAPCMPGWGCVAWFDANVRSTPGNSGSGILDARGALIGVLSFGVGPNITGAIPASLIPFPDTRTTCVPSTGGA